MQEPVMPHPACLADMATLDRDDAFCCHFTATESTVRDVLAKLSDWLHRSAIEAQAQGTVELVLAETLNNIVEHAYAAQDQRQPGQAHLAIWRQDTHLHFEVIDHGAPLPGHALPVAKLPNSDVPLDDLPEGGFGWFLISSLTCGLRYTREADKNTLCFSIAINDTSSA